MHLEGQQSARTISDEQNNSLSIVRLPGGSFPISPNKRGWCPYFDLTPV